MPRAVHGNAIEVGVQRGEHANNFDVGSLMEDVEGPGRIFTAAPGKEDAFHAPYSNAGKWIRRRPDATGMIPPPSRSRVPPANE